RWAWGVAPGTSRGGWAFQRLPTFDAAAFRRAVGESRPEPCRDVAAWGVDVSSRAVKAARENLRRAGLADSVRLTVADAFAWEPPPGPGLVLVNPPYGGRIEASPDQWRRLGDLLKRSYRGWRAVVIAGDEGRGKHIGLRPSLRLPVRNGPIDARILRFDLY
ncbi:MAG: class I SAM-dependent RNA methyltransferase, partial [Thermoanaerobaculia bacterium]|nr:class I SAM-dependent RNA methyltransferase [Thermoanaerobaculia bacterium]